MMLMMMLMALLMMLVIRLGVEEGGSVDVAGVVLCWKSAPPKLAMKYGKQRTLLIGPMWLDSREQST